MYEQHHQPQAHAVKPKHRCRHDVAKALDAHGKAEIVVGNRKGTEGGDGDDDDQKWTDDASGHCRLAKDEGANDANGRYKR